MPQQPKSVKTLKKEKGKLYGDQLERLETEPSPTKELSPKCPGRFTSTEKKEWRYFKRILENYGLFTIANAPILELLSTNMVHYKECLDKINKSSIIIKTKAGGIAYNPYFTAMNKLEDKIHKCLSELGLSSSALARLGTAVVRGRKQKKEMEELID